MFVERTDDEVIIRLPGSVKTGDLQRLVNYLRYKELTRNLRTPQRDIDKLSRTVKRDWWKKNRDRFRE